MTFHGTGTFIVGEGRVAVIDPGPPDEAHLAALLGALRGESVTHIVVTHTHRDHSPLARALKEATGAPIVGCGRHRTPPAEGGEGADYDHAPDQVLEEGEAIAGPGWTLGAVATPGHTANHLCFAFAQQGLLFSGDVVMGWSTTVVSPPDGNMAAYCASLARLAGRAERWFLPTHGPAVTDPPSWCAALLRHRLAREAQILGALADAPATLATLVGRIYPDIAPNLRRPATRSTLAHLEKLVEDGRVRGEGEAWRLRRPRPPATT
ncbi:MAG: MBL fold metallo-hydrolase [Acetobacteraceae bacterium]|nr:MBL fold metallo-hydrolase [Acetobacteraceae bacterium]